MKYEIILICVLLILVFTSGCKSQNFITEDQAFNAVKSFENNQNLQLVSNGLEQESDPYNDSNEINVYKIKTTSSSDIEWVVNAISGEITDVCYWSRIPSSDSNTPYGTYTKDQARQIATNFVSAKYTDFDNLGFQLLSESWDNDGWGFGWHQINTYGAHTRNFINVNVNSNTGLIQMYHCKRYTVFAPTQAPSITSQQAIPIATQAAGITNLDSNDNPILYANSTTFYWSVGVVGTDNNNSIIDVSVDIDAYTGTVISVDTPGAAIFAPAINKVNIKKQMNNSSNKKLMDKVNLKPIKKKTVSEKKENKKTVDLKSSFNKKQISKQKKSTKQPVLTKK